MTEPDREWRQRLVGAVGAVVAVGLVIGGVLGAVAYSAARVTGLAGDETQAAASADAQDDGGPEAAEAPPSASPSTADPTPTTVGKTSREGDKARKSRKSAAQDRAKDERRANRRSQRDSDKRHDSDKQKQRVRLTLAASPRQVRPMGRIHLAGRYPGHGGARLVVQRFERGHWARFPVTVTVRGGRFRTWVASGRRGENRFRVVDPRARRASAAVTVRVR